MESLESRIGYKFNNPLLLTEALTHPSLAYESRNPQFDNQRLEFLGDAVLQLILTDKLYREFPANCEGKLTKLRSQLVSRSALYVYAEKLDLGQFLLLGKGEASTGGRERPSNLADAFEAIMGAIYLDGGLESARRFLFQNLGDLISQTINEPYINNPKGELQETLQAISTNSPIYELLSEEGPDHEKVFISAVIWEGLQLGAGRGSSKKESETRAATDALEQKLWSKIHLEDEASGLGKTCENFP